VLTELSRETEEKFLPSSGYKCYIPSRGVAQISDFLKINVRQREFLNATSDSFLQVW
jgi:hypothetical protein